MDKINILLIGVFVFSLSFLFTLLVYVPFDERQPVTFNYNDHYINQPATERVELYYNIDNPSVAYERQGEAFKEVVING